MVEFVSYTGHYPCLCLGTLTLKIDGKKIVFPEGCMISTGYVGFDEDWMEYVETGKWLVSVPEKYEEYADEICEVVNSNVPWGCCGGCI